MRVMKHRLDGGHLAIDTRILNFAATADLTYEIDENEKLTMRDDNGPAIRQNARAAFAYLRDRQDKAAKARFK